jgi:hypothetical protein
MQSSLKVTYAKYQPTVGAPIALITFPSWENITNENFKAYVTVT